MAKFVRLSNASEVDVTYIFFCPGCQCGHYVRVKGPSGAVWQWNGDVEKPTVSPSILVFENELNMRCHSFIKDGKIQFLDDCFHALRGRTVDLPDDP